MIVSYYSIFLQKSILWLRCMYYSDESSRVKQGRGEGWLHKICTNRTAYFSYGFSSYGPHSCSLRYASINSVVLWAITLLFFFFRIIYL